MKLRTSVSALFCLASSNALSCSCLPVTMAQHASRADEIYFATLDHRIVVPASDQQFPSIEGKFSIVSTLKGRPQERSVTLRTGIDQGACGVSMLVSATYLIFKKHGHDFLSLCDGSYPLGPAGKLAQQKAALKSEIVAALNGLARAAKPQK